MDYGRQFYVPYMKKGNENIEEHCKQLTVNDVNEKFNQSYTIDDCEIYYDVTDTKEKYIDKYTTEYQVALKVFVGRQ